MNISAQQIYDTMRTERVSPGNYSIEDAATGQQFKMHELSEYTGRVEWGITINGDPCEVTSTLEQAKVMAARTISYCRNLQAHGMEQMNANGGMPYHETVPFEQNDTIRTSRYIYG